MKALVFNEVLRPLSLEKMAIALPKNNEVKVHLKACALNHRDVWITKGLYPNLIPNVIPGSCGAGLDGERAVIINPNVNWGHNPDYPDHSSYSILGMPVNGTFAEYVVVGEDRLVDKPDHLSMIEAAALPLAGLTAYRALITKARISSNEKVLINGIGGGVALFAFQFAVAMGAEVYVTSGSEEKIQKAIGLGAKGGCNYLDEKWAKSFSGDFGGIDVVIDSAGGEGFNQLLKICNPQARIVVYGGGQGTSHLSPQDLFFKEIEIHGSTMGNDEEFNKMVAFVNLHKIKPIIDSVYDFEDFEAAFQKMEQGKQFGKIVLKI